MSTLESRLAELNAPDRLAADNAEFSRWLSVERMRSSRRGLFRAAALGLVSAPFLMGRAEAANVQKLAAGGVSAYTDMGFTASDFNSAVNGKVTVAASTVTNATNLDLYAQVSFSIVNGVTTTTQASYFQFYGLELNQDGTTYGDGVATGTTLPAAHQLLQTADLAIGIASGGTLTGTTKWFPMPGGVLKFAHINSSGGAMNASAAAVFKYRTFNFNLNG